MKIGFDISQTGTGKAGCGYLADSLITNLAELDTQNSYLLYSALGTGFWDPEHARATRTIKQKNFKRLFTRFSHRECMNFWGAPEDDFEEKIGSPDILHINNFFCPKGLKKTRLVYTLYDLQFIDHPEWTTEANRCTCFNGMFNAALQADMMISISYHTKQHFLEIFPFYPENRIKVVHLASRFSPDDKVKGAVNIPPGLQTDKFWLAVGTLEPRKNLRRLLKAFSLAKQVHGLDFTLALAGGKGWLEDDLAEYIQSLGIENNVFVLGYVTDEQLHWLYENCYAFAYPTLFEGFGLPVLEAMSMGAAVITSNTSSLPEVAGDAAIKIHPENENELLKAILNVCEDDKLRMELKKKALAWSKQFSWKKAARQVLEAYHEVLDKEPHVIH